MSGRIPYFVRPRMDAIEWLAISVPLAATLAGALVMGWLFLMSG